MQWTAELERVSLLAVPWYSTEEADMVDVTSVKNYFETLPQRFQAEAAKSIQAVFQFELAGDGGGTYHVTVDHGKMAVVEGAHAAPTATIKMNGDDYVKMVNGQLNGAMAFMKGQMKVTGNVLLAQKMQSIFPPKK
ncbi:MAG TPA: SCP2 sterol-binding domain-containing protein [Polyangia bacterium]|nr:SCP2 sterol-binding domain-containing protein [Polyangia bacterium]